MFCWNDELLIGVKEIDDQHYELCQMANNLFEEFINGKIITEIEPALKYFEDYVTNHFELEESFQLSIEYPNYIEHKKRHEEFKKVINELKEKLQTQEINNSLVEKFKYTIVDWLIFHLREYDADIANYVKDKKSQID